MFKNSLANRAFIFGISLMTGLLSSSGLHAQIPPFDGWVLERTFGEGIVSHCLDFDVSSSGNLYVIGFSHTRVYKIDQSNQATVVASIQGSGATIAGIAVRNENRLYFGNDRGVLYVFNMETSQFVPFVPGVAYTGTNIFPSIDSLGRLYVTDSTTVHRYDSQDNYLGSWGVIPQLGGLPLPKYRVSFSTDGNVVLIRGSKVLLFTPEGQYLKELYTEDPLYGVDASSGLFVVRNRVVDMNSNLLGYTPVEGISVRFGSGGAIYACPGNSALKIFKIKPAYRTPDTLIGAGALPIAQVVTVLPRPGTTLVDIDITVHDYDSSTVETAVLALVGGSYSISSARKISSLVEGTSGNIGQSISSNTQKRLTWDAALDLSGSQFVQAKILVLANDGRGIVDIHYVTMPQNIPNSGDPSLIISDTPITDADMLNAWMWLLAKGDPEVGLVGGSLVKVGGAGAGAILATGTTTTAVGRSYLFGRLNVHEASAAEILRAKTGTTPGIQQYEPMKRVGARPVKINEIGFDTGATSGSWVVPN